MKNLYKFIFGLLLGILVSAISYYGIEYFLLKNPEKECKDVNECILKEMPTPVKETQTELNNKNIISQTNINANLKISGNITNSGKSKNTKAAQASLLKIISIILIIIISIFLIYFYFKK